MTNPPCDALSKRLKKRSLARGKSRNGSEVVCLSRVLHAKQKPDEKNRQLSQDYVLLLAKASATSQHNLLFDLWLGTREGFT
jgi:hypothetical protein